MIDRYWWFRQTSGTRGDVLQEIAGDMGLADGPWILGVWEVGGTLGRWSMFGCLAGRQSRRTGRQRVSPGEGSQEKAAPPHMRRFF